MTQPAPQATESSENPPSNGSVSETETPSLPFGFGTQRKGRRIAEKLFLSYVLPLAVLIVAGIMLPVVLWSYLGQPGIEYDKRAHFAARTVDLRRFAMDSETQIRGFVLYRDPSFAQAFTKARNDFRSMGRELTELAEQDGTPRLTIQLQNSLQGYEEWVRTYAQPEIRRLRQPQLPERPEPPSLVTSSQTRIGFVSVRANLDTLVEIADNHSRQMYAQKQFAETLRQVTSFAIPLASVLLAILIGRSIALGITRPLEDLTRATEALEKGEVNPLVIAESANLTFPDDEIGDLQRGFQKMAHTIGQREAVLRAQNEALGALNRRVEAVLNATNDGIVLLDRAGAFAVVNQRFSEFFGVEADVLVDQPYAHAAPLLLSRFRHRAHVRTRLEEIVRDPSAMVEETFEIAEPVSRTVRVYSAPVQGEAALDNTDGLLGRIFVFRDVTRETAVDKMKTEFVSTVSHELRTPLTAIKGYVDLMLGGQTGPLSSVQHEFLTMTQGSTERLTALINDMLDISRIESGRMEMRQESVNYIPLAEDAIRLMQREAESKHITLTLDVKKRDQMPLVRGDADRITQALVNFISNGIKYTPPQGKVQVIIEPESDFVTTCVADTGIGIAASDQPRLFQKFFRADNSTTRAAGGTGLGLAITKALLEKLGGSVWVESAPNKGSKFWFTLPVAEATPEGDTVPLPSEAPPARTDSGGQPLILNIDSDPATLHRLGHELRRHGYITSNATTATEALRRAKGLRPDLITIDLLTPGFDAFTLLRTLRETPNTQTIRVALVSLHVAGARIEVSDGFAYLPRDVAPDLLGDYIRTSLGPKILSEDGSGSSASRNTRAVVLVVGDSTLAEKVRDALAGVSTVHIVTTASPDEADSRVSGLFPELVVLDTAAAPGTAAGQWIARLKNRRPGVRLPAIILTAPEILSGETFPLPQQGSGAIKLERVSTVLDQYLHHDSPETEVATTKH